MVTSCKQLCKSDGDGDDDERVLLRSGSPPDGCSNQLSLSTILCEYEWFLVWGGGAGPSEHVSTSTVYIGRYIRASQHFHFRHRDTDTLNTSIA